MAGKTAIELHREIEAKSAILNARATKVYEETGTLNDPVLCELSHEIDALGMEYHRMMADDSLWVFDNKSDSEKSKDEAGE